MARKRYQKGSVALRGDVWYGRYWKDVLVDGQRRRKYASVRLGTIRDYPTKRLAARALEPLLAEVNSPLYRARPVTPVRQFASRWAAVMGPQLKPSTALNYASVLRRYIVPVLGDLRLDEVTPEVVQQFVSSITRSPKTVRNVVMVLRSMWKTAEDWGYVTHDAFRGVQLPKGGRTERRHLQIHEMRRLIDHADEPYKTLYWLAAETGLRAGELCGLQWNDIDIMDRRVYVRQAVWRGRLQSPKSAGSTRVVAVSGRLAAHLARLRPGGDGSAVRLLFPTRNATPLDPNLIVKRHLRPLAARLQIELPRGSGLHSFRHAQATVAHRMGVPLKVVQQRLGHASPQLTFDVYTHAESRDERHFVEQLDSELGEFAHKQTQTEKPEPVAVATNSGYLN